MFSVVGLGGHHCSPLRSPLRQTVIFLSVPPRSRLRLREGLLSQVTQPASAKVGSETQLFWLQSPYGLATVSHQSPLSLSFPTGCLEKALFRLSLQQSLPPRVSGRLNTVVTGTQVLGGFSFIQ